MAPYGRLFGGAVRTSGNAVVSATSTKAGVSASPRALLDSEMLKPLGLLVGAEILAFALLERAVQDKAHDTALTAAAVAVFLVVPFCFKAMLQQGETIAVANLYWIVLSMVLGALLTAVVFRERVGGLQVAGMVLATAGAVLAFMDK